MKEIKLYDAVSYAGHEWFIIRIDNDKVTLLAKNDDFGHRCFDKDSNEYKTSEIRRYINTVVLNELTENGAYLETVPIQDLGDKIFLLSVDEAKELPKEIRQFSKWYWLRSPSYSSDNTAGVGSDGCVFTGGYYVYFDVGCVRPVVKVHVSNLV